MNSSAAAPIARRTLAVEIAGAHHSVPVTIYLPQASGEDWSCAYEIGWPGRPRRAEAHGVDSVQALLLALQRVGVELYAARPAGVDDLQWLEKGGGLGFPLPRAMRDMAVGDDRLM